MTSLLNPSRFETLMLKRLIFDLRLVLKCYSNPENYSRDTKLYRKRIRRFLICLFSTLRTID